MEWLSQAWQEEYSMPLRRRRRLMFLPVEALLPDFAPDLLLVNGYPDEDIKATRDIDSVYI
jgi:hypothetical protein